MRVIIPHITKSKSPQVWGFCLRNFLSKKGQLGLNAAFALSATESNCTDNNQEYTDNQHWPHSPDNTESLKDNFDICSFIFLKFTLQRPPVDLPPAWLILAWTKSTSAPLFTIELFQVHHLLPYGTCESRRTVCQSPPFQ